MSGGRRGGFWGARPGPANTARDAGGHVLRRRATPPQHTHGRPKRLVAPSTGAAIGTAIGEANQVLRERDSREGGALKARSVARDHVSSLEEHQRPIFEEGLQWPGLSRVLAGRGQGSGSPDPPCIVFHPREPLGLGLGLGLGLELEIRQRASAASPRPLPVSTAWRSPIAGHCSRPDGAAGLGAGLPPREVNMDSQEYTLRQPPRSRSAWRKAASIWGAGTVLR